MTQPTAPKALFSPQISQNFLTVSRYAKKIIENSGTKNITFGAHGSYHGKPSENVFGWEVKKWDGQEYWLVMTGKKGSTMKGKENDGIDGAIVRRQGQTPAHNNPVSAFVCTIEVEDVDESCSKVVQNAGNVVVDKMAVPGIGWICYRKDTEGNIFGLLQTDSEAK